MNAIRIGPKAMVVMKMSFFVHIELSIVALLCRKFAAIYKMGNNEWVSRCLWKTL